VSLSSQCGQAKPDNSIQVMLQELLKAAATTTATTATTTAAATTTTITSTFAVSMCFSLLFFVGFHGFYGV